MAIIAVIAKRSNKLVRCYLLLRAKLWHDEDTAGIQCIRDDGRRNWIHVVVSSQMIVYDVNR